MIDTDRISERYRERAIRVDPRQLLVTNFKGTEQERDLTEPPNCEGFGRLRHFKRETSLGWPQNPLPIDPALARLGRPRADSLRAQVFQNAVCNWRCWYCFVPFDLLAANREHSSWKTPAELVDLYLNQEEPPQVIDLTGGQPDLTPEWVPWMMEELASRGFSDRTFLWSDDNLSNDYFWRFLSPAQRNVVVEYSNYGRVGCFKGFDPISFGFNTKADPVLFAQQFELFGRHVAEGVDAYAYVTLTTPVDTNIPRLMANFVDRLQRIDLALPLRTVPLEIQVFSPVLGRIGPAQEQALRHQWNAVEVWNEELQRRFTPAERAMPIHEVPLRRKPSSITQRHD